jgi:hypothetical protein
LQTDKKFIIKIISSVALPPVAPLSQKRMNDQITIDQNEKSAIVVVFKKFA